MPEILGRIPNGLLLLVGRGYRKAALASLAKGLGVEKNVEFAGFQPFERLPSFINAAQVGIIPHIWALYGATMPNKLFQFMMLGLPVVVSDDPALRRVVEDTQGGLVFEQEDSKTFARQVIRLAQDPVMRNKLGDNGRKAVQEKYNWDQTVQLLLELYRNLKKRV
jgi:glycosyltransferase involved in cell wall biosynthesis